MGKAAKLIAASREFKLETKWWKTVKPMSLKKTGVSEALRTYEKALADAPKAKGTEARTDAYMAVINAAKGLIDPLRKAQAGLKKMKGQDELLALVEKALVRIYAEKHPVILEYKQQVQELSHVPKSIPLAWVVDRDCKWIMKLFDTDDMMNDSDVASLVAIISHVSIQASKAKQAAEKLRITADSPQADMTAKFFHISQMGGGLQTKKGRFQQITKSLAKKYSVKRNLEAALKDYWKKAEAVFKALARKMAADYKHACRLAAAGETNYAASANYEIQRPTLLKKMFPVIKDSSGRSIDAIHEVSSLKKAA